MSTHASDYDTIVVGAGPNGLAAAVALARAGQTVCVLEANETIGGAARSAELTEPGFMHDLGSAIHPMAAASPFFRTLPLERYGLEWVHPEIPLAHPLDGGRAAVLHRALDETRAALGADASAYHTVMAPLVEQWPALADEILQPVLHWPRHPLLLARFGLRAVQPTTVLARAAFQTPGARALFAGIAAHSALPLTAPGSSAFGLVLGALGHAVGWPFPRGGAQHISNALAAYLRDLGGDIVTGQRVQSLDELPPARSVVLDVTPRQLVRIAGDALPARYRRRLQSYRYGPAVFKVDYALDEPIPWASAACRRAGTVHLGGTLDEIAVAEKAASHERIPDQPFILLAQHSLFDASRAPEGKHTAWAYCHMPHGVRADMTERIEQQIERFAPGFREVIRARHVSTPMDLQQMNANLVGGDINGGTLSLPQIVARPVLSASPYRTPVDGLYLCSSSTPPGGGVHGMCGYHAAQAALKDMR
jgi:phytoene dehydrogenase-like protein